MFKKVKIIASTLILSGTVFFTNKVLAQEIQFGQLRTGRNLEQYISSALTFAIWAAGLLSVAFIIIGGFQYITAGASKEGAGKAKNTLLYAIIGLVVVMLALVIRNFVLSKLELPTPGI